MPFAANMDELETLISEVSQKEKDKYHMISFHIWNLRHGTSEPFHRKENHGHGEQTCDCQGRGGREWDGLGIWG